MISILFFVFFVFFIRKVNGFFDFLRRINEAQYSIKNNINNEENNSEHALNRSTLVISNNIVFD